jgi:hypothetical protein
MSAQFSKDFSSKKAPKGPLATKCFKDIVEDEDDSDATLTEASKQFKTSAVEVNLVVDEVT